MKANSPFGCVLLRLPILLTMLTALPWLATNAAEPDITKADLDNALNAERDKLNVAAVTGTWKNADLKMTMTFSETGDFEFKREKDGESKVEKGLYKVTANAKGDGVIVSVFFFQGKDYFAVTPTSKDRATWSEIKSPADKPDPAKSIVWTRGGGAGERAEPMPAPGIPAPGNAKDAELQALQTPATLIGKWKSTNNDGTVTTTSFSESGEFSYARTGKKGFAAKGTYTAETVNGVVFVVLKEGEVKAYFAIVMLSKNHYAQQLMKSPSDRLDPDKSEILKRVP